MYDDNHCPITGQFSNPQNRYYETTPLPILERKQPGGRVVRQKAPDEIRFESILQNITTYLQSTFNSSYIKQKLVALYSDILNRNYEAAYTKAIICKNDQRFYKTSYFYKSPMATKALEIVNECIGATIYEIQVPKTFSGISPFDIIADEYQPHTAFIQAAASPNDETTLLDDDYHFISGPSSVMCIKWDESKKMELPTVLTHLKELFLSTGCKAPNDCLLLALLTFQKAQCFESLLGNFTGVTALNGDKQYLLERQKIVISGHSQKNDQLFISISQKINGYKDQWQDLDYKYSSPACLEISYWLTGGNGAPITLSKMSSRIYSNSSHRGATRASLKAEIAAIWQAMLTYLDKESKDNADIQKKLNEFYTIMGWTNDLTARCIPSLLGIFRDYPHLKC